MKLEHITSSKNQKIKYLLKMQNNSKSNSFFIEGFNLIVEAIKANRLKELYLLENQLEMIQISNEIEVFVINEMIANKLSQTKTSQTIFGVCSKTESVAIKGDVLLLDNIQDPGNLGTLIRSGLGLDFANVFMNESGVDFYNDKVIRSTQGAIFYTNLNKVNLQKQIIELKKLDYLIIATHLHKESILLKDLVIRSEQKCAIIIGNESKGISDDIIQLADINVYIDINGQLESLNAAISGAIIMNKIKELKSYV